MIMVQAADDDDDAGFVIALGQLLAAVRALGTPLTTDALTPSEMVLPAADTPLEEVRALLRDDGLIPG